MNQAVVLAAGKGERLKPITNNRSKAMLPILAKPIVLRVVENLFENGLEDILIVISPNDREMIDFFGAKEYGVGSVRLIHQPQPLGTANALLQAAPFLKNDFMLTACDSLFNLADIGRMITSWGDHHNLGGLLALRRVDPVAVVNSGIVKLDGDEVVRIVEKPALEDAPSDIASLPLYCFSPNILTYLSDVKPSQRGEYELQDAIQMLVDDGGLVEGIQVSDRLNLTKPSDLLNINLDFLQADLEQLDVDTSAIGAGTQFIPPVKIEKDVVIGKSCTIGPNVYIEKESFIGDQVTIQDAVLLHGAYATKSMNIANELLW